MKEEMKIRVLVTDDHPVVREGLAATLSYQPDMEVVGKAAHGGEALALFRQELPDIALMDLQMPVMDGVSAIAAIRAEFPAARILVLTTYDGDEDIYNALRAGALGYLLKDTPMREVLEAIRAVTSGKKYVPTAVAAKLIERMNGESLTEREREVLRLIAKGNSNQEIASALFVVEGTVKSHVTHILHKLNVADRTEAVTEAMRRGVLHL